MDGIAAILAAVSEEGADGLSFPPRQLAELMLALETGVALEQLANPAAFGGVGLPLFHRLRDWFAMPRATVPEER